MASSSARISRNIDASGLNQRVQNSVKSGPVGNVGVSGGNTWNDRGNRVQFIRVHISSNSKSEDDDTSTVSSVDDTGELSGIDVVESISQHDEDSGDVSSN